MFHNKVSTDEITDEAAQVLGASAVNDIESMNNRDGTLVALFVKADCKKSRINKVASDFFGKVLHDTAFVFRNTPEGLCSLDLDSVFPRRELKVVQITPNGHFSERVVHYRTPAEIPQFIGKEFMQKYNAVALEGVKVSKNRKLHFACFYYQCDASRHGIPNPFGAMFVPGKAIDDSIYVCKINSTNTLADTQTRDVEKLFRMDEVQEIPKEVIPKEPAQEIPEEPAQVIIEEPAQENPEEPVQEIPEEPVQEIPEEPAQDIAEEPAQEILEEPAQEILEEPVQQQQKEEVVPSANVVALVDRIVDEVIEDGRRRQQEEQELLLLQQQQQPKRKVVAATTGKRQRYQNQCDISLENIVVVDNNNDEDDCGPRRSTRQRKQRVLN